MKRITLFLIFIALQSMCMADSRLDKWVETDYIWNFGLISSCDHGLMKSPIQYFKYDHPLDVNSYQSIKQGDTVWVKCKDIPLFAEKVLPKTEYPFVLVIADGDESFPSECGSGFDIESFLNDSRIIRVFAQNCDYSGPSSKVTPIPIGVDYHSIAYKSSNGLWGEKGSPYKQESDFNAILSGLKPTHKRKKRIFADFQHSDSMRYGNLERYLKCGEDRTSIFNFLLTTGLVDYGKKMRRSKLWKTKGNYAFSVSPHGNGLDCHRTWEDLILGCIVIVKTSSLDPLYEGLPVVIVNDWSEITEESLTLWLNKYKDAFSNPDYRERLSLEYWKNKIRSL